MSEVRKTMPGNAAEVLERRVAGYHRYVLGVPARLSYASRNLCQMTGFSAEELLSGTEDGYLRMVHPQDRAAYEAFLARIGTGEMTLTSEYRIIRKDGTELSVRDTAVSSREQDGTFVSDHVLTDVTDLRHENDGLRFLNDTVPCGFIRYTCEKQPRITYINQRMIDMLRFPEAKDGELDYLELYRSSIFLMIPMEERRRFSKYLDRVYAAGAPIAGEMTLLRCDGTRAYVFGWVTKCVNENGEEEFQSACMDITDRHEVRKDAETKRYIKALTDVYEKIFEFDLNANTVRCLHCEDDSSFKRFEEIPMRMDEALGRWIMSAVEPGDCERVRAFFRDFRSKRQAGPDEMPPQISYRARSSANELLRYNGLFIKVDDAVSLYCCRKVVDSGETEALRSENDRLKADMKQLAMNFSDGIAAFQVNAEGLVKPLYASENVCEFFGYTREQWLPMTERFTPYEDFIAHSEAANEDFAELLRTGEAEFVYFDYKTEAERRIRAVCSQKTPGSGSSRFIMLYSVEDGAPAGQKVLPDDRTVSLRTFGYFDVFVGGRPIAFRNKKAKELLALLTDRRGGFVTSEEAISFLWEDEPASPVTMARYRKVALRLKNTLEEYGIPDIIESVDGKRRIVTEKVECDLYDYLSGREEYAQLFRGSYLTNYSWAETTLGELMSGQ